MSDRIRTLTGFLRYLEGRDGSDGDDYERYKRRIRSGGGAEFLSKIRQYMTDAGLDVGSFLRRQAASDNIEEMTPLHVASAYGQLETVKFLVEEQHVDPRDNRLCGHTPLNIAAMVGHLNIVKYFIEEQKCDPMCQDAAGRAPLHTACHGGNLDIVKYLISQQNVDPSQSDEVGITPLHYACCDGNIEVVTYLLTQEKVDPNSEDMFGETPLHVASQYGHVDVVKLLVHQKKCKVLVQRKIDNCAPIHLAALKGSLEVVQYFVEVGCDSNLEDGLGRSPLYAACQGGHLNIVKYLVDECKVNPCVKMSGCDMTPVHFAARHGHLEVIRYLVLDKGCDSNCCDKFGDTPLHDASTDGHLEVVKFLIVELKCDPSCKGRLDRTPVYNACLDGCLEMVQYLVEECKVSISGRDQKGVTPLQLASASKNLELVKYLVAKQCDPHRSDNVAGYTCLHVACISGSLDIVRFLIMEQNCNVSAVDGDDDTVLHLAALRGHLNIVKYLVEEQKCSPMCKGQNGSLPLHAAAQNGHIAVVKYLVENCSVNPHTKDDRGILPIHLAAGKGQMACMEYLYSYKQSADGKPSSTGPSDGARGSSLPQQRPDLAAAALATLLLGQHAEEKLSIRHPLKTTTVEKSVTPIIDQKPRLAHLKYMAAIGGEAVQIIRTLAPVWYQLGISFDFDQCGDLVSQIHAQERDHVLCCEQVFRNWLAGKGEKQPATWRVLIKLLQEMEQNALVDKIQLALDSISSSAKTKAILKKHQISELEPYVKKAVPTGKSLGHGTYGCVEEFKDELGTVYAGKKLRSDISTNLRKFYQSFSTEFLTLSTLKHPHIVQYHGICFLQDSELPVLLMEQLKTDLHSFLKDPNNSDLAFDDKLIILHGVASGLAYLHSQSVVHRDLSAKNVLVISSPSLTAKISDFGNSCIANIDCDADFEASSTLVGGTMLYMPPEHYTPEAKHSTALDIFSFGHLALFVGTQNFPKFLLPSTYNNPLTEVKRRQKYFDELENKLGKTHPLITHIAKCLNDEPKLRPSANELVTQLTSMK